MFKKIRIYYCNARGIKSKTDSLNQIVNEKDPSIVCLTETHLAKKETIEIEGYTNFYHNKTSDSGGIVIGVKNEIAKFCKEVNRISQPGEQLWIRLSNTKTKLRIGVVYAPQESRNKKEVFKKMYEDIISEINEAKTNCEKLFIIGDLNCKIDKKITKSGNILLKTIKEYDLCTINSLSVTVGKWTRIEGKSKSVIDYGLILDADKSFVNSVNIDEEKLCTPYRIHENNCTYSDHNAITCDLNIYAASCVPKNTSIIFTKRSAKKFKRLTENNPDFKKVMDKLNDKSVGLKERYYTWQSSISDIVKSCSVIVKRNKTFKTKRVYKLMKMKRTIKAWRTSESSFEKKETLKFQEKLLDSYIQDEQKSNRAKKINDLVNKLKKEGGMNTSAFWEFKKKMDKSNECQKGIIKNSEGKKLYEDEEIKAEYRKFYEDLLKSSEPEDDIEKQSMEINDIVFESMKIVNNAKKSDINITDIKNVIKDIKNKKSVDRQGMSNFMIKNAGDDFIKSLDIIFSEIMETQVFPNEWSEATIVSLFKKGDPLLLTNRRGIFITSVVRKIFEKIRLKKKESEFAQGISPFQCGGLKSRSICDHILTLNAVIDYNQYLNKSTLVWFGDAVKCFDNLNLKDCTKELAYVTGISEAIMMYNLNEKGIAQIKTPIGLTNEFNYNEVVMQGTPYGTNYCTISTDKVNTVGTKCVTLIRNIEIKSCSFVDDIVQPASQISVINNAIENCNNLEKLKMFTFNNDVKKSGVLKIKKPKEREVELKIEGKVKMGSISQIKKYKYLGQWYQEDGSKEAFMSEKESKINYMVSEAKRYGNPYCLGKFAISARLTIYEIVIFPTIFYGLETWTCISEKNIERIEKIQAKILTGIFELSEKTPYWGLLSETGLWPVKERIVYKRIMLFQDIVKSDDKRLVKTIVKDQIAKSYNGWVDQIKKDCQEMNLNIEDIKDMKKECLKKQLKEKLLNIIKEKFAMKKENMTKLRFINEFKKKEYLNCSAKEVINMLKIRLNMLKCKNNFKGDFINDLKCTYCNENKIDSTEHLFNCKYIESLSNENFNEELIMETNELSAKKCIRLIETVEKVREI